MIGKNNPFNIRYQRLNNWKGQIGYTKGFVNFLSRQYGIRAAYILLLRSYRRIGVDTIDSIVRRFAPSIENDTERYISFVSNFTNILRFKHLTTLEQYRKVLLAMSVFEGNPVILEELTECERQFKIRLYDCAG